MIKIKFMLLSLVFIAIIGSGLAFKAKFHTDYCLGAIQPNGCNLCAVKFDGLSTTNGQFILFSCYTTTTNSDFCLQDQPVCADFPARFVRD